MGSIRLLALYSYEPKPKASEGTMLMEQDTNKVFVRHHGEWDPFPHFEVSFVDLWQDLPTPPAGVWTVRSLADWVPPRALAAQIVAQTVRISAGPERHVTFGVRGRGADVERKGVGVVRTGAMLPFRANFVTMLAHLNTERAIELFVDSDGPDASAAFTLSGYFIQGV